MTISPKARAAAVVRDYYATDLDVINGAEGEKRTIEALIATAIREACNEKLEEAERAILNEHSITNSDDLNMGLLRATRAVKAIRSLKDTTP